MPDRSVLPRPSLSVPGTADPLKPVAHVCYCVLANFGLLPFCGLTCPGTASIAIVLPFPHCNTVNSDNSNVHGLLPLLMTSLVNSQPSSD